MSAFITAVTEAKYKSQFVPSKYIPYLTLTVEILDVFYEDLVDNWTRYNGTILYLPWMIWITVDVFLVIPSIFENFGAAKTLHLFQENIGIMHVGLYKGQDHIVLMR